MASDSRKLLYFYHNTTDPRRDLVTAADLATARRLNPAFTNTPGVVGSPFPLGWIERRSAFRLFLARFRRKHNIRPTPAPEATPIRNIARRLADSPLRHLEPAAASFVLNAPSRVLLAPATKPKCRTPGAGTRARHRAFASLQADFSAVLAEFDVNTPSRPPAPSVQQQSSPANELAALSPCSLLIDDSPFPPSLEQNRSPLFTPVSPSALPTSLLLAPSPHRQPFSQLQHTHIRRHLNANSRYDHYGDNNEVDMSDDQNGEPAYPAPEATDQDAAYACTFVDAEVACRICRQAFPSNNRLHEHVRKSHKKSAGNPSKNY